MDPTSAGPSRPRPPSSAAPSSSVSSAQMFTPATPGTHNDGEDKIFSWEADGDVGKPADGPSGRVTPTAAPPARSPSPPLPGTTLVWVNERSHSMATAHPPPDTTLVAVSERSHSVATTAVLDAVSVQGLGGSSAGDSDSPSSAVAPQ
eukprot:gene7204-172_t